MTDKQFARRLAKLNTLLWDCIGEAETLLNEAKNKNIDEKMRELFSQYNEEGVVDCELNNATLSDISHLIKSMVDQILKNIVLYFYHVQRYNIYVFNRVERKKVPNRNVRNFLRLWVNSANFFLLYFFSLQPNSGRKKV